MSQGRDSAKSLVLVSVICLLCLFVLLKGANAATYTVGGPSGWSFNTDTWPNGKRFRAGDILVFKYDSTSHNVVAVDKSGYSNCRSTAGARVFRSGNDQIKLGKGQNYFICNYPGHCESGMKISINAV
ncbi:basic blue protein [Vigna radiata var. radiata]|uniref:Basic blue protein n=1 Tax=Vigna radiata var. radiata TaxID=3916 RepID=A0A1S3VVA8_VIGRR|nr:basic blue protein [Vigna radiata var. radiata]